MSVKPALNFSLRVTGAAVAVGLAALPLAAQAAFVAPIGLNPGDPYRLIFYTSDVIAGSSTDIATYDAFVTAQAALAGDLPSLSWRAVASTLSVDAIDHLSCLGACASAPIYSIDGRFIASNAMALFAPGPTAAIGDQFGSDGNGGWAGWSWTGTADGGRASPGDELGAVDGTATYGCNTSYGTFYWLNCWNGTSTDYQASVMGLSGANWGAETTNTPEPLSGALLASGLAVLAAARKRRAARAG